MNACLSHALTVRNIALVEVFGVFVGLLFVFGFIYYSLYRRRRSHFAFNSDILATRRTNFKDHCADQIPRVDLQIDRLRELLRFFDSDKTASKKVDKGVKLSSGTDYKIGSVTYYFAHGAATSFYLEILDQGKTIGVFPVGPVQSLMWEFGSGKRVVANFLKRTERNRLDLLTRLGTTSEAWPDIWSYLDFVYFATISQTTIGYGDILPNSTTVRVLVITQVLIAYALLIVVLNIVVGLS
jgi:Ion channel